MTVIGILWVILTPYCTGLVVASSRHANRLVTRHVYVAVALGWSAIGVLFAGVFAVGGRSGVVMALASAPFIGLAFWKAGPGRDDDDSQPDPEPDPPTGRTGLRLPAPARRRPTPHPGAPRPSRPRTPAR